MKVSISRNAWHAKLYVWFYQHGYLPNSLCPYFWSMVFAVVASPIVYLLSAPAYLYMRLMKGKYHASEQRQEGPNIAHILGGSCLWGSLVLFMGFVLQILFFVGLATHDYSTVFWVFIMGVCGSLGVLVGSKWHDKRRKALAAINAKEWEEYQKQNPGTEWWHYSAFISDRERARKKKYAWMDPCSWLATKYIISFFKGICPIIDWKK